MIVVSLSARRLVGSLTCGQKWPFLIAQPANNPRFPRGESERKEIFRLLSVRPSGLIYLYRRPNFVWRIRFSLTAKDGEIFEFLHLSSFCVWVTKDSQKSSVRKRKYKGGKEGVWQNGKRRRGKLFSLLPSPPSSFLPVIFHSLLPAPSKESSSTTRHSPNIKNTFLKNQIWILSWYPHGIFLGSWRLWVEFRSISSSTSIGRRDSFPFTILPGEKKYKIANSAASFFSPLRIHFNFSPLLNLLPNVRNRIEPRSENCNPKQFPCP